MKNIFNVTSLLLFVAPLMPGHVIAQVKKSRYNTLEDASPAKLESAFTKEMSPQQQKLMSFVEVREIVLKSPPAKVWKIAEGGRIFAEGYPAFSDFVAVSTLCSFIEEHPKREEFVDLMLEKIKTIPMTSPEIEIGFHNWNDIAIIGSGGISGLLISSVTRIGSAQDCPKIVDSILATKDVAKLKKLKEVIVISPHRQEFEKLLRDK